MAEVISNNLAIVVIGLVLLVVIAWWLLAASRRTKIERTGEPPSDSLPARRNQALIDAPTAAIDAVDVPPPTPESLAGAGAAVAAAAAPVHEPVHHDDLKRIKGVGPKLEALLRSLGVTSYSQIAAWDDDEIDRIDAQLGTFAGRIRRDDWKTQAGYLASGDMAGFEQRFGRL